MAEIHDLNESDNIPVMLTIKEASEKTKLSYGFIRKLCYQNKIVFIKCGNKFLINLNTLIKYLEKGDVTND